MNSENHVGRCKQQIISNICKAGDRLEHMMMENHDFSRQAKNLIEVTNSTDELNYNRMVLVLIYTECRNP